MSLSVRAGCALLVTALAACGGSADPAPRDTPPCSSALPYRGALPLHAALPHSTWPLDDDGAWLRTSVPTSLANDLSTQLQAVLRETGAPGATVAVGVAGQGLWTQTQGLARNAPATAVDNNSLFWWASVGKAYTASLVQQSAQRSRLRLDEPISRWWPQFPEARHITINHLLNHTSGLRSFNSGELDTPLPPDVYHSPDTIIHTAQASSNLFCPGAYWSYSNTGYVMLGRALELSEQTPYAQLMQQRVFAPLGLQHSRVIEPGGATPGLVVSHPGNLPKDDPAQATPFAAGGIAARADDVLRFWHAWLTGALVPTATARSSFDALYPMFDSTRSYYGQGVMVTEWTDEQGRARRWLAHLGGAPGANAVVAYDPLLNAYVAVAINSDVSAVATASTLLKTLETWRKQQALE